MKKVTSKLPSALVALLLLVAAVTAASAQTADELAQTVEELAAKGFAIAEKDPIVAGARTAEPDIYYWKGFDVATGIFGDPALGALGNTTTGPGSLKIRDSLDAAGQRGFNASVKFHLSRNYTHKRRRGEVTSIDKKSIGAITDLENGNPEPAWAKPASDEIRCRGSALPGT